MQTTKVKATIMPLKMRTGSSSTISCRFFEGKAPLVNTGESGIFAYLLIGVLQRNKALAKSGLFRKEDVPNLTHPLVFTPRVVAAHA